jgi:hypothetical protein
MMKRKNPEVSAEPGEERPVGRRALLVRGGAVAAGAAGALAASAALASPAGAAVSDAVLQGEVNDVGTDVAATEITADNDPSTPTPTLILTNTGGDTSTTEASPNLRLTPAASALVQPASGTVGGDVLVTGDGELWFTHDFGSEGGIVPATVHTDATDNLFLPGAAPSRVLDTRSSSGRANILDASGNLNSSGMLIGGKTIHVNLTSLVNLGNAVTANLTVTQPTAGGFITLWSGAVARPSTSVINFAKGQTIANLTVSGLAEFSTTATDTVAIFASVTTHLILDVTGFTVQNAGQINPAFLGGSQTASARAKRARKAATTARKFR